MALRIDSRSALAAEFQAAVYLSTIGGNLLQSTLSGPAHTTVGRSPMPLPSGVSGENPTAKVMRSCASSSAGRLEVRGVVGPDVVEDAHASLGVALVPGREVLADDLRKIDPGGFRSHAKLDEDARAILRSFEEIGREGGYVDPFNLALVHVGLREHDEALSQLERCATEGSVQNWIIAPEPFFDALRQEPRFREVLRRLSLPDWTPPTDL